MTKPGKPLLAFTMGDPCGIGSEVMLRALVNRRARAAARFVIFGSEAVLRQVAESFDLRFPRMTRISPGEAPGKKGGVLLLDEIRCAPALALRGHATAAGGHASIAWIESAVAAAVRGEVDGIVTGPISKEAIHKAGHEWPGHTELIAARSGGKRPVMTMVGDGLRVALVTTHVAVRDLPRAITRRKVLETLRVVHHDLRQYFGIKRPRIAVCGLNPHAGEAGRFGDEEKRAIAPAVRHAREEGIACDGPTPADVVFTKRHLARHDAVVAMYHDQATIPVKMIAFDRGVNVTLGLPIIRTSPDHGTAYDIVKKGIADPGSTIEAIRLAAHMATCRRRSR